MEIDIYTKLGRNLYKKRPELGVNSSNFKWGEERGAACSGCCKRKIDTSAFFGHAR
jgi:hypothetical protein